jgi:hypothetical protein
MSRLFVFDWQFIAVPVLAVVAAAVAVLAGWRSGGARDRWADFRFLAVVFLLGGMYLLVGGICLYALWLHPLRLELWGGAVVVFAPPSLLIGAFLHERKTQGLKNKKSRSTTI